LLHLGDPALGVAGLDSYKPNSDVSSGNRRGVPGRIVSWPSYILNTTCFSQVENSAPPLKTL
jgi:hypothetical protein